MNDSVLEQGCELVKHAWVKSKIGRQSFFKAIMLILILDLLLKPLEYISPFANMIVHSLLSFSFYIGFLYVSKSLDQENTFSMKELFSFWETKNLGPLLMSFICYLSLLALLSQLVDYLIHTFLKVSEPMAMFTSLMSHFTLPVCLIFVLLPFVMFQQKLTFIPALKKVLASVWNNIFVYSVSVIVLTSLPPVLLNLVLSSLGKDFPLGYTFFLIFLVGIFFYYLNAVANYLLYAYYKKYL